ncbi:MAG TPA: glycosyl hydrolase 108 family protein [Cytophagaceae bacterium]|jgi:lysozyme family protein|nr:glycosyl hydrolase 108 family protein [Cytophagaceae bacterium]
MANFSIYYPKLLKYEGGYASAAYAAKMGDSGGETYCGIARNYNLDWPGWKLIDAYIAKNGEPNYNAIIPDQDLYKLALGLSKQKYWDKIKMDAVNNQSVAEMTMDFGFNSGINTSVKAVQSILKIPCTGLITDADIAAINRADQNSLFTQLQNYRVDLIIKSTKINPKFKNGLVARAKSFSFSA